MTDRSEIVEVLLADRVEMREKHAAGLGGLDVVRALSESTDRAVRELWERIAGDEARLSLVALGGYGRQELSPHSDIDLMVLHGGSGRAAEVSERLFYALWDAGLVVGHATRTPKDCLRLARENLEAETSFLQPRLIAGDAALFEAFAERVLRQTRKRARAFVAGVRGMMRDRHAASGSATSQLEPNIKEGAGGLRDLHVLGWLDRVVENGESLIRDTEREQLGSAAELLNRVRNHLHYATGRQTDTLLFEFQRDAARFLCYLDGDRPAEDAFMRDLFTATRSVEHIVNAVIADLGIDRERPPRTAEPFAVAGGRAVVAREPDLAAEPERALELFSLGAPPGAAALRWLDGALGDVATIGWSDAVRRAFVRLLLLGDARALEAADQAGVLGRLIPEWEAVRCQPQHNVYHRFTVDAHLFETVAQTCALASADDPLVRDVFADLSDPGGLALAALLHDAGKGTEEDHAVRGEQVARAILDRMGIGEPRRSRIQWLVRHHLLLVEAATRRDLNDENFVVDVATRIGEAERAKMLFLLSVADGRATGETAWTPWKAALVAELFTKVVHVIERGELVGRDALDLVRLREAELREALTRHPATSVEAHLAGMPRAYFLAFPTTELIRHFALVAEPVDDSDARAHAGPAGEGGAYVYTVVARDRPGLFGKVSGVLALNGLNILSAQVFTSADGVAIETFRCVGAFETAIDEARWHRVTEDVRRALRGRLSLEARLAEKRAAYDRSPKAKRRPPRVIVDNHASDFLTVVEVHAPDRVGLLYDITSALAELALDIQLAKIATHGEDVVDVFYVRDLEGQKVTDAEHIAETERALLRRLERG